MAVARIKRVGAVLETHPNDTMESSRFPSYRSGAFESTAAPTNTMHRHPAPTAETLTESKAAAGAPGVNIRLNAYRKHHALIRITSHESQASVSTFPQ